jgi:hypothetical protein
MNTKATLRVTIAWALCLCLMLMSISFAPSSLSTSKAEPVANADNPDLAEGARQFDEAVRDIEGILNLDLTTEKGVRESAAILKRNEKKLAQVEKKALHAALRVSSFQKGLKDEAAKRKGGAEELAKELEANHELVGTIPGAEEAARAIRDSTRPAAEAMQRVSEALKKASASWKKKDSSGNLHHAPSVKVSLTKTPFVIVSPRNASPASFCGSYKYICDLLVRLGLYTLRNAVAALSAVGTQASCQIYAYRRYSDCASEVGQLPPWEWWWIGKCSFIYSMAVLNCLLSSN